MQISAVPTRPHWLWVTWLTLTALGVMVFGLSLVLLHGPSQKSFSFIMYGESGRIAGLGPEAERYIQCLHAVLGSVMVGWGGLLLLVVRGPYAQGLRQGWWFVTLSVLAWFLADTLVSLATGYWRNAMLNTMFLAIFAVPLVATIGFSRDSARGGRGLV